MAKIKKLIDKAKNSRKNFKYSDAVRILEHCGYTKRSQRGSHAVYVNNDEELSHITITEKNGEIPPYQLANILAAVELSKLKDGDEDNE